MSPRVAGNTRHLASEFRGLHVYLDVEGIQMVIGVTVSVVLRNVRDLESASRGSSLTSLENGVLSSRFPFQS